MTWFKAIWFQVTRSQKKPIRPEFQHSQFGSPVDMLFDSGSQCNFITSLFTKLLSLRTEMSANSIFII